MALPGFLERALRNNPYEGLGSWVYARVGPPVIAEHHRRLAERLAREMPQGARLLDVGCGPGDFLLRLAGMRSDLSLVGVDPAGSAMDICKAKARRQGLSSLRFVQGAAQELPFDDASFEAAVSTGAYKHWPNRPGGLREISRVLKPGAGFYLYELDPELGPDRLSAVAGAVGAIGVPLMRRFNQLFSLPRARVRDDVLASGFGLLSEDIVEGLPLYEFILQKRAAK